MQSSKPTIIREENIFYLKTKKSHNNIRCKSSGCKFYNIDAILSKEIACGHDLLFIYKVPQGDLVSVFVHIQEFSGTLVAFIYSKKEEEKEEAKKNNST